MVMNAFTHNVAAAMLIGPAGVAKFPAGCFISKLQPLVVCINKLFKSILRECWEDHVVKVVKESGDEGNNIFKLNFKP